MIAKPSIKPGIVVHMDPETLLAGGSTTTAPDGVRVKDVHYFICLDRTEAWAKWIPCFTDNGPERQAIQQQEKTGHPGWTQGGSYYHPAQLWDAPHEAAIEAAKVGNDLSKPNARNGVTDAALARVRAHAGLV